MVSPIIPPWKHRRYLIHRLLSEDRDPTDEHKFKHPWWQVMCLTGVDYFSILGYQPGIAALAAGALSPLATLILVLVTLFGALAIYLSLNLIVIGIGGYQVLQQPSLLDNWQTALTATHASPWMMVAVSVLLFPKLALGLSGFETGVAVMPLVKGTPDDTEKYPSGRIRHTHYLLTTAAGLMSFFLLTSSVMTTVVNCDGQSSS